jgi:hypothetical protein
MAENKGISTDRYWAEGWTTYDLTLNKSTFPYWIFKTKDGIEVNLRSITGGGEVRWLVRIDQLTKDDREAMEFYEITFDNPDEDDPRLTQAEMLAETINARATR